MITTSSSSSASGSLIEVNGASIYYEERGSGPALVLIHGGLGSSAMWEPLLGYLTDSYRVITPDSRGHGRSTNPDGRLSYPLLADDMAAFIAALDLERPVVGGWSDGGQVSLELGARHPDVAGGLIIGAAYHDFSAPGFHEAHVQELAIGEDGVPDPAGVEQTLGDFADLVKSWHAGGERQWHELVRQTGPMWLDYPGLTPADLNRIETPALVLVGDRDESFSLEIMVQLFRLLPYSELAVCPASDHLGPLLPERAEIFASVIRDFVDRLRADT